MWGGELHDPGRFTLRPKDPLYPLNKSLGASGGLSVHLDLEKTNFSCSYRDCKAVSYNPYASHHIDDSPVISLHKAFKDFHVRLAAIFFNIIQLVTQKASLYEVKTKLQIHNI